MVQGAGVINVVLIGAFPPPVHGSSKNLLALAEDLEEQAIVERIDTSPGRLGRGLGYHFSKSAKVFQGLIRLAFMPKSRFYITLDAGFGMIYSLIFLVLARAKCMDVFIQHRSFAYISKKNIIAGLISRLVPRASHIFLCKCMKSSYEERYGKVASSYLVSNLSRVSPDIVHEKYDGSLRMGYLSNITVEKGFLDVLNLFRELKKSSVNVILHLAGPFADIESEEAFNSVMVEYPEFIKYSGPVYGEDKNAFFRSVDVFLFPTKYVNEAQPNVVFEAMAKGALILTTDRGCIGEDVSSEHGAVFEEEKFVSKSLNFILNLNGKLEELREKSLQKVNEKYTYSLSEYGRLLRDLADGY